MGELKAPHSTSSSSEVGDEQAISKATSIVSQDKQEKEDPELAEVSNRHLTSLLEFKDELDNAAKQALATRQSYNRIVALVLYWEGADGLEDLRSKADKLSTKFSNTFGFETKTMPIPSDDDAQEDFKLQLLTEVRKVGKDPRSLLIMYYGGHADNKKNKLVWMKENSPTSERIEWSEWQCFLLKLTVCDKLFLMDCCHAGDIIERMAWKGACELLGASSGALQASAKPESSFTKALLKILKESTIWDIRDIYASFTDSQKREETYGLKVDPFFWDYSNGLHPPLCLRPAKSKQILTPGQADVEKTKTISDARILIKVVFHGEASIVMKEWKRFLSQPPKAVTSFAFNACREASLIGLWQSNSCIAIWALPIWLWAGLLPTAKGFEFLGIVRSRNVAAIEYDMDVLTSSTKKLPVPLLNEAIMVPTPVEQGSSAIDKRTSSATKAHSGGYQEPPFQISPAAKQKSMSPQKSMLPFASTPRGSRLATEDDQGDALNPLCRDAQCLTSPAVFSVAASSKPSRIPQQDLSYFADFNHKKGQKDVKTERNLQKGRKDIKMERDLQKGLSQERLQNKLGIDFDTRLDLSSLIVGLEDKRRMKLWGLGKRREALAM